MVFMSSVAEIPICGCFIDMEQDIGPWWCEIDTRITTLDRYGTVTG